MLRWTLFRLANATININKHPLEFARDIAITAKKTFTAVIRHSLSLPLTLTRVYQSICIIWLIIYVYLHQFDKRQCFDGKQRTTTNMNDEMVTLLLHLSIYHSVCVCCYLSEASINLFVFSALFMWLFSVPEHITHIMLLQTKADPEKKWREREVKDVPFYLGEGKWRWKGGNRKESENLILVTERSRKIDSEYLMNVNKRRS